MVSPVKLTQVASLARGLNGFVGISFPHLSPATAPCSPSVSELYPLKIELSPPFVIYLPWACPGPRSWVDPL